jgi:predicted signal transduction protein with EAL and GGDEF domain
LGGDEFALLVPGLGDPGASAAVAAKVVRLLNEPFRVDGRVVQAGSSVGIALAPRDGASADELMAAADLALYRAKAEGRGRHQFFDASLRRAVEERRALEAELQRAVAQEEFVLHYQPQFDLADGSLVGAEALIRWNHPQRGLLTPAAFLPVLEGGTLAIAVGEWVLRTACRQARAWADAGLPTLRVGVNLSAAQFRCKNLAANLARVLAATDWPPELLEVEVTENILLKREMAVADSLRRIRALGVSVAFDDFGTGYASLSHLQQFALDRIKIDRSFVRDIGSRTDGAAITRSVIALGKSLGIKVTAEGIETHDQAAFLRLHGCDEAQGYLFGRPMPADALSGRCRAEGAAGLRRGTPAGAGCGGRLGLAPGVAVSP